MYQKRNVPPLRIAKSSSKLSQEDTSEESFQNVVFFPVYMMFSGVISQVFCKFAPILI